MMTSLFQEAETGREAAGYSLRAIQCSQVCMAHPQCLEHMMSISIFLVFHTQDLREINQNISKTKEKKLKTKILKDAMG